MHKYANISLFAQEIFRFGWSFIIGAMKSQIAMNKKLHNSKQPIDPQERSARIAVLAFPVFILAGAVLAMFIPQWFQPLTPAITPLLGFIMLTMGLTLTLPDFALIAKRPAVVLLGVLAQFGIMPLAAWLVGTLLDLDPALKFGLLMLGSVPGGTTSNVVTYLAKGDVALSVTLTSCSTILSPILTPLIMLFYADKTLQLDGAGLALGLVQTVLIPVIAGLVLRALFNRYVEKILPVMPWLSVFAIGVVVFTTVANSADTLKSAGMLILLAVILHNAIGYALGWLVGRIFGYSPAVNRAIAIEVGTQSAALSSKMSVQFYGADPIASAQAGLPGAVAAVWHNIAGALFAFMVRRFDARRTN